MKKQLLIPLLLLAGALHAADFPVPEKEVTPLMRRMKAACEKSMASIRGLWPADWVTQVGVRNGAFFDDGKLPDHRLTFYPTTEGLFNPLWIKMPPLSPEEATFAYRCLGEIGVAGIPSKQYLLSYIDLKGISVNMTTSKGLPADGTALKIINWTLPVRYSKEAKKQADEMNRVNTAAVEAAVAVHKTMMDNREPDYAKNYPRATDEEAQLAAAKIPGIHYVWMKQTLNLRQECFKFRADQLERNMGVSEEMLARVFVRFLPEEKDRVRDYLTRAGYPTPDARREFWARLAAEPKHYFNETHIALIYDPKKP